MELPHIGEHCSEVACRQLDFLPFTCSLCKKVYCLQHQSLSAHHCPKASSLDVQVPVCPLCNQAVSAPRGQPPDIAISQHLDNNCHVKKERIFKNKCSRAGCHKKELMPIQCRECGLNYCIPHRHPNDHQCSKGARNGLSSVGNPTSSTNGTFLQTLRDQAASRLGLGNSSSSTASNSRSNESSSSSNIRSTWEQRQRTEAAPDRGRPSREKLAQMQGNMSEEEALALALSQSEGSSSPNNSTVANSSAQPLNSTRTPPAFNPEDEDAMLQQAIAASLRATNSATSNPRRNSDCSLL